MHNNHINMVSDGWLLWFIYISPYFIWIYLFSSAFSTPPFHLCGGKLLSHMYKDDYSCLKVNLMFTRDRAFYFTTVFIPGIILVTSSFITFWLEWNAVPARVMIGMYINVYKKYYFFHIILICNAIWRKSQRISLLSFMHIIIYFYYSNYFFYCNIKFCKKSIPSLYTVKIAFFSIVCSIYSYF